MCLKYLAQVTKSFKSIFNDMFPISSCVKLVLNIVLFKIFSTLVYFNLLQKMSKTTFDFFDALSLLIHFVFKLLRRETSLNSELNDDSSLLKDLPLFFLVLNLIIYATVRQIWSNPNNIKKMPISSTMVLYVAISFLTSASS